MGDPSRKLDGGGDYEVIRISISWGALSIALFVLLMALVIFGDLRLAQFVFATLSLSIAGSVVGLVGFRFGRSRRAARVGLFLNGVVLVCYFVLVPLIYQVLRRLG